MYRSQECQLLCTRAYNVSRGAHIGEEDVCDLAFRGVNLVPENYFIYSRWEMKCKHAGRAALSEFALISLWTALTSLGNTRNAHCTHAAAAKVSFNDAYQTFTLLGCVESYICCLH